MLYKNNNKYVSFIALTIIFTFSYNLYANDNNNLSSGKKFYQSGIGVNGKPISATGAGKLEIEGENASCANCHKRSGLGSSEGGLLIPSITSDSLFNSREFKYKELERNTNRPITRKSYNSKTLKRAIKYGIDSNGRKLKPLMPRYNINEEDMKNIVSYLSSLGKNPAPGINKDTINFATIITPNVDAKDKSAMLAILDKYTKSLNSETRVETRRSKNSPWHKKWSYSAFRKWKLHVWQLKGEEETWPEQLVQYYKDTPVFSILSGLGSGSWQSIHNFCNNNEIPCLFPNTDLPGNSKNKDNHYSIYFSEGIILEAKVIAKHIIKMEKTDKCDNVIQIINSSKKTHAAADEVKSSLRRYNNKINFKDLFINSPSFNYFTNNNLITSNSNICLIHWVNNTILNKIKIKSLNIGKTYITSNAELIPENNSTLNSIYYSMPYSLKENRKKHLRRTMIWAKINKISPIVEGITANTYSAITTMAMAVKQIKNNFSRDYLIERLEHMIDDAAFHSIFKHFTFGPGQRYASKGAYIIGPTNITEENKIEWIVP